MKFTPSLEYDFTIFVLSNNVKNFILSLKLLNKKKIIDYCSIYFFKEVNSLFGRFSTKIDDSRILRCLLFSVRTNLLMHFNLIFKSFFLLNLSKSI